MYERKSDKLLPFPRFVARVCFSLAMALSIAAAALFAGTLGYHQFARLGWLDSELNAAMILTGMGPVDPMRSSAAKLFASAYALFSGGIFLTSIGIVLAPVIHRIAHTLHIVDGRKNGGGPG
jgi:hypothetical protein